ncbi:MAG: PKD domain-containing protein [Bacteroidia bacterium]
MKSRILTLILFTLFALPELYAQANCTGQDYCICNIGTNPPSGTGLYPLGTVINNTMIPCWSVLFGTPIIGPGVGGTTGIQLVSDASTGEGAFTCYTFRPNTGYKICISAVNTNQVTGGQFILEAHNGSTGQIITNSVFFSGTMQEHSYTFFNGSTTFTQLRIYTNHTSGSGYSVSFDDVGVVEIPVVTSTPATIDGCGTATLTANSNNPLNVSWSGNGLTSTSGTTVTARPCSTTTYTATYDSDDCWDGWACDKTEQVTVVVQPGIQTTATPSTIDACGSSRLRATSTNPMNVTWFPTTGLTPSNGVGNVVTARPCSTTTYRATFMCSNGCTYTSDVTVYVQPVLNVTASPQTISGCQSTTLTASSTNAMSVSWSPLTGLTPANGNGTVVTARPCKTTTYTATFTCFTGCTYTKTITVYVQPDGNIVNPSTNIPCRDPISMHHSGNPCPGSTYKWYHPNGNLLTTAATLNMISSKPSDQGTYTLLLTSPQGCIDTFYSVVTMTGCCDITADFKIIGCNPVRFENITKNGNGDTVLVGDWHWDLGDGNTSSLRNPSHLYTTQMGPTTVCLTTVVYDQYSTCCDKVCKNVDVCDFVSCDPKAAFDHKILHQPTGQVQFLDKSVGGGTANGWIWKVNGTAVDWTQNPILTLGGPGTYEICLTVSYTDINGTICSETWCEKVVVQ